MGVFYLVFYLGIKKDPHDYWIVRKNMQNERSNPSLSSGESGANLTSSIMLGYARSDSGPCRLGPTHAVIALVSAPGSTLADSHVAGPRGRSEEWYYKRGFWPRPFHYTEENRQRMLDPIEADD